MPKSFGNLMKFFTEDILNDFTKEHLADWNSLDKNDQKILTKIMSQEAAQVIKSHYGIR